MNPQYIPYAGPPQQGFPPPNHRPPNVQQQGSFENVPLGPQKQPFPTPQPPQHNHLNMPPQRPPMNQLPPQQRPPSANDPSQFQNGPDAPLLPRPGPAVSASPKPMLSGQFAPPPSAQLPPNHTSQLPPSSLPPQGQLPPQNQRPRSQFPPPATQGHEGLQNQGGIPPQPPAGELPGPPMQGQMSQNQAAGQLPPVQGQLNQPPVTQLPSSLIQQGQFPPQNVAQFPSSPHSSTPIQNNIPPQNLQKQNYPQNNPSRPFAPNQPNPLPPSNPPIQNMPPYNLPPQSMPANNLPPQSKPNIPPQRAPQYPPPPMPNHGIPPPIQTAPGFPPPQQQLQQSRPPLPGQMPPPPGPNNVYNQLPNQMQQMNLGPQYPGVPNRAMNGDGGPHMPPPLHQQQPYLNGQQGRPGYPTMAGQPMPGQPPMPNQPPMPPMQNYGQPTFAGQQQQQPARKLDPDQMPSPIQVIQDDQANRSGVFCTNQKGLVPPLVTTNFVVQDQGFASPRYLRATMYNVPVTTDQMKQTAVPFGLVISPMARTAEGEYPPPIVDFGELGPVRCIRCKAYMSPFMQFIDSGRRFQCLFCKASTDVPAEYFQHLDHTGQRLDKFQRPELVLGAYECTATKDYCRNNIPPKPPALIFIIDVSYNNIKSGMVALLCAQMKELLRHLPVDEGQEKSLMKVGFITYDNSVHFYNIKGSLAAPQMMVVGDTTEMFMPLLEGFLSTPEESEAVIDALMEQIPLMFAETRQCETVLLPAIVAGLEALKASECAGKLLVFNSTLPAAEAPGKLKTRDDRKLLGTDKENTILSPQNRSYNQLGQSCVESACSVDLFLCANSYIDLATIGQVSRLTGGDVYKYSYFQADIDGERLINDVITNISRPIAFDGIMRVRTSTGVRPTDFYGHMFMSNTTDIELASIDCDKAIAVEVKHDDKLQEDEGIYIQVALLYTSVSGQRRLRIINQALKTCSQMADLYRSCDLETIINFFSKQSVYKLLESNPKTVKDAIVQRAAQMLANYRKNCASPSSAGQLILPECMKLLPLYVNCLLKSDALSGGSEMSVDDRSFVMQTVMTMDVPTSVSYFYPRLVPVQDITPSDDGVVEIPAPIRCTIEKMTDQGVYILENGIHMFLWIGLGANQEFVQQVFGVPSAVQINIEQFSVPELDNPLSEAVRSVIEQIRSQRHRFMRLTLVRPKEKMEAVFRHFLVEDRGMDGTLSYVDFLCHMHKEIRTILS